MKWLFVPEFRKPIYNRTGTVDCEINHPEFGWIPFTCDASDTSPPVDSVRLLAAIEKTGDIAEYVHPDRSNVFRPLPNDIFHAMRDTIGITDTKVEAAIVASTEAGLERNLAMRRFHRAVSYRRDSRLLRELTKALGLSEFDMDDAWRQAETFL